MTTNLPTGRSIRIFLRDGDPAGTRTAEITMSTTQAIAFRRSQLKNLGSELREMIARPGAYILMGGDDESAEREAYIGESEDVRRRLGTHNSASGKELWEDTIVLVSKDANVTKSHVAMSNPCFSSKPATAVIGRFQIDRTLLPPQADCPPQIVSTWSASSQRPRSWSTSLVTTGSIAGQIHGAWRGLAGIRYAWIRRLDALEPLLDVTGKLIQRAVS